MVNLDYLYNPEAAKPHFDKNYFLDNKLSFKVIENGMILPYSNTSDDGRINNIGFGGIVDSNGEYIKESYIHYGTGGAYTPAPESIQHRSETVIYLFILYPLWEHCITDDIRRIWFLKSDIFKSEFKNCPLVYISWRKQNLEIKQDFKRLLEILEVDVDRIQEITQPTQFEKIILPDDCFGSPHNEIVGFTNEYREMIDHVRSFGLKHSTPTSAKKLYFFHGKKGQFGEERLSEYFESKGYEIINPAKQKLTLDEELNLLVNCKSFAAAVGSSAHNSLFLREGTETILIPRIASFFPYYQEIINQVNLTNAFYIDSTLSILNAGIGGGAWFFMISEQLKRFFGDKWDGYEEEDFNNFLRYVKNYLGAGFVMQPKAKDQYAPIFSDFMAQLKQREDLIAACDMPLKWETFQPSLAYQTHVHKKGWSTWQNEERISDSTEDKLDIQAVKINFPGHKVYYSVYYNEKEGWSKEVLSPETAGIAGKNKPIYGIRIWLDEAGTKEFDILYRVHKFDGKWTSWAKNGESIYSQGVKLNVLQMKLRPLLTYQTHIDHRGWNDGWKKENQISNNIKRQLNVQAIKINFPDHKVYYSVYYNEKEGWSEEVISPETAGIAGKSKPIYGMKAHLDESDAKDFDIFYRVHKFDGEWTTWAKNGETLYSYGVMLNGIQIKLELKT